MRKDEFKWTPKAKKSFQLVQDKLSTVFFSEKLNDARRRYFTYYVEFYAIIQALRHWRPYLIQMKFLLNLDHEALKHINSQASLNQRHINWVAYKHTTFCVET
jgi:hypothetical protein